MATNAPALIIVESPAKARTLKRFLGSRFDVRASMGHVRDLPERELAVDVEHDFRPHYEVVDDRAGVIKDLRSAVGRGGREVILASDPDREGEAIAWHLAEVLKLRDPKRIEFHEITNAAVTRALDNPRTIDMRLVNAQQARRIVDRLVGYRLSPFLWSKIQKGIGAGRVQSVALRLVVDRELEIRAFVPVESWTVDAVLSRPGEERTFSAGVQRRLDGAEPGKGEKLELGDEASATAVLRALEGAAYAVAGVERRQRSKSAPPPFITSTLQQDASSRLRFAPRRTMRIAQDLYEGIELGAEGATGLITYMRTDSTRVSEEAEGKVKAWIKSQLGEKYLGRPRAEKARKGAQEAHEAIRPTDPGRRPESVRQYLSAEQFRLYELIWRRFVASRMAPAVYAQTTAAIHSSGHDAGGYELRASGSVLTFDGFYKVWDRDEDDEESRLPELIEGESLSFHELKSEQHFTQPPPRYSEASLIKELEERGIGRPSTYAAIIEQIQRHRYVEQRERRLHPTDLGEGVNRIMVEHFGPIANDNFTAELESRLDRVESGEVEWVPVVGDFYQPLEDMLSRANLAIPADTGEVCPQCGKGHLVLRASRFGPFKACSERCGYRMAVSPTGEAAEPKLLDEKCPTCGRPLQVRRGRFGEFTGCSGYPECRYIKRDQAEEKHTGQSCPKCQQGELIERSGRFGPYLTCSRREEGCDYRANIRNGQLVEAKPKAEPKVLDEPCPVCGKNLVERQSRFGPFKSCPDWPKCPGPKGAAKSREKGGGKSGSKAGTKASSAPKRRTSTRR